jgi:hypothetical protein
LDKGQAQAINNQIKSRLFIEWFPREYVNFLVAGAFNDDFSQPIFEIAIKTANEFLDKNSDTVGCEIVKVFLQESSNNPYRPISSGELKRKLNTKGIKINDPIHEIAQLRNKGVFIVSPLGKRGYKLSCNEKEIAEYYDRLSSNVIPQLRRGHILHKILTEQSISKYNVLGNERYSLLNSLIDKVVNNQNNPY